MAIADDMPDESTQQPPLSCQLFNSHNTLNLSAVGHGASDVTDVSLHEQLPNHTALSDGYCTAKSTLSASSGPCSHSRETKATYQSDSLASDDAASDAVSSRSNNTDCSSRIDAASGNAVSSLGVYGRDAFMKSELVSHVLDMGFDHETVRNVVHLKIVQSGENYATPGDLVEAVLAYIVAMTDDDDDDERRFSDQQQQVKAAETTANSASQQHHHRDVGDFDVTDGSSVRAAAAAVRNQPGKKKKVRRNKNAAGSSRNTSSRSQAAAAAQLSDAELVGLFTKLPTSTSDTVGSMDRLPWQIEMENKQLKAAKTCKICLEADIEVVFIPCGHLVSCHGCSSLVSRCSLCQSSVTDTVKIYMS